MLFFNFTFLFLLCLEMFEKIGNTFSLKLFHFMTGFYNDQSKSTNVIGTAKKYNIDG
jgi:hypothetical protein